MRSEKRILVVGGGFGGIKAALELSRKNLPNTKIILVSDKPHFEYYPLFYRVLVGHSPLEACIPLADIFAETDVEVIEDTIDHIDTKEQTLISINDTRYRYDELILALGSETAYYDLPGLKDLSFNVQSITSVLRLKKHLHHIFSECKVANPDTKNCDAHIVIVGGGATGCGIAGMMATYARDLAKRHGIDPSFVTIDLIHSGPRLIPTLSANASERVKHHLYALGVNIFLNRRVMKDEVAEVYLKDVKLRTKTLVWCAGVQPSSFYRRISDFELDKSGRVVVDGHLQAKNCKNIFVIGDGAATEHAGLALSAIADAHYVAEYLQHKFQHRSFHNYVVKMQKPIVPISSGWGVGSLGPLTFYSETAWLLKRFWDLHFFMSILPWRKALTAFLEDQVLWETCPICSQAAIWYSV